METLWSPWRSKYIQTFKDEGKDSCEKQCFFCHAVNSANEFDAENLVVARFTHCFAMLNRYPYNSGHLLIAPNRHIGDFGDFTSEENSEIMSTIQLAIKVIDSVSGPHGYNIGANLGRVAGAGVPDHIHFHVVPRWNGDTSFMSTLADVKIVSEAMEDTQKALSNGFKSLVVKCEII